MEPLSAPGQDRGPARRVLLVAALIQFGLFVSAVHLAAVNLIVHPDSSHPACIGCPDGPGYYAWLRAPLVEGDFRFEEDFAPIAEMWPGVRVSFPRTKTGRLFNPWSVGPALVWAPAVLAVHGTLTTLGSHSPWPADGFSPPYDLAVGLTTFALSLLTLALTYRIARRFAGPTRAALAAALLTLGTPIVAHGTVLLAMSHGPASAALALYVFVWLKTFGRPRWGRWLAVGALLGVAAMMRWQLVTYAILPALEAGWRIARAGGWKARAGLAFRLVACGLAAGVAYLPQMAVKQIVFGNPLGVTHRTGHNWLTPSLWTVLGSFDRSLFYWTPVTLAAAWGFVSLVARRRQPAAVILLAGVAAQVWAIAAILGEDVFLGHSFGFRFLTETCVPLAAGLAALLERVPARRARSIAVASGLLVGWNLALLAAYRSGRGAAEADPVEMVVIVSQTVLKRPFEIIGSAVAAWAVTVTVAQSLRPAAIAAVRIPLGNRREPESIRAAA